MRKSLIISSLAILLTLSIAGISVWADSGLLNKKSGGNGSFHAIIQTAFAIVDELKGLHQDVNLNDTQKASVRAILVNAKPQAEDLHKQLKEQRHQLREALLSANPDSARVQSISQQIANTSTQLTLLHLQTIDQISQQLTPAQRQIALKDLNQIDPLIDELKDEVESMIMNAHK